MTKYVFKMERTDPLWFPRSKEDGNPPDQVVTFELNGDEGLGEIVEGFAFFLKGCGFMFYDLDVIDEDPDETGEKELEDEWDDHDDEFDGPRDSCDSCNKTEVEPVSL